MLRSDEQTQLRNEPRHSGSGAVPSAERSGSLSLRFGDCRVVLYESYDLSSSEALYISDAKHLQLWLYEHESDFSAFDEMLDFDVVSRRIEAAEQWR